MNPKKLIPIIVAIVLCILFVMYARRVMKQGDKGPSTLLKDDHSIEDVMEGFDFEED